LHWPELHIGVCVLRSADYSCGRYFAGKKFLLQRRDFVLSDSDTPDWIWADGKPVMHSSGHRHAEPADHYRVVHTAEPAAGAALAPVSGPTADWQPDLRQQA